MSDGNTAQETRTTTTTTTTTSSPGPTSNDQGLGERMRPILKTLSFEDGQAALMPPPDPGDGGPKPVLSPPAEDLFDDAELALGHGKPKTRKAGRLPARRGTALEVLRRIGQAEASVRKEVVTALDRDDSLRSLMKTATPKAIWADEAAAAAILEVLRARDPGRCKDDIVEITKVQVKLFRKDGGKWIDAGANRWEARVAWEMLLILPDAEREAVLGGSSTAAADVKVETAVGKAERNMSNEYKNSSRYDTYSGDGAKTMPVVETEKEPEKKAEKEPEKKAEKEPEKPKPVATTEDTDRQALLAAALSPELWETAPTERLKGTLRMVIQADEAAVVAPLVKQHWKAHSALLASLGFAEDGTWSEKIVDKTATTWFGRTIAATTAISQTVGVLLGALAGRVRFKGEIDLQALAKGFPNMAGLQLKPHERPTDPVAILSYALGGIGPVKQVMKWCGVSSESELLQALTEAKHAGKWLLKRLAEAGAVAEGLADLEALLADDKGKGKRDEGKENMLVVEGNGLTGEKRIAIPALEIAATSRRSGTSLLKTGASSLYGIELAFKGRTALDQKRSVSVKVGAVHIGQLLKTDPQGMVALESLDLGGMTLELESPETNPATWLEKLRDLVIHIASRVIEMMPFKGAAIGAKALKFGVVATRAFLEGTALMRDAASIVAKLGAIDAVGFVQSDGGHLDKLSVGESELSVKDPNGLGMHLGTGLDERGDKRIKREHERAVREQERSAKKIERAKDKGKDERVKKLEERKAQAARVEERTATTLADRRDLRAVDAELAKAKAELEAAVKGNDPKAREQAEGRVKELQIERAMVETRRLEVEGHIGAIDVQGMDMGGMKAESVHVAKTELSSERQSLESTKDAGKDTTKEADKDAGKDDGSGADKESKVTKTETRKLEVKNAEITMSGVELSQDRRRDVAVRAEIESLEKSLVPDKDPTRAMSKEQRASTEKRIADLRAEGKMLEPVVAEYELLRSRLRDLDEDDRARFLALRKQLESPSTLKIDKVEVKNVALQVDLASEVTRATNGETGEVKKTQSTEAGLNATVGHLGVHGIEKKDDARGTMGGDLSVKSVSADNLRVSAMGDLEALLAGRASESQGGGFSVKHAEVNDIKIDGARDEATRQIAANAQTRARLEAEITRIQQKAKPAATDSAQIAALRAQIAGLADEDARLTREHLEARPRLLAFAGSIEAKKKALVSDGIDMSRGTSLNALFESAKGARKAIAAVDSKKLRDRIAQYDAGIAALEAEIKEIPTAGLKYQWDPKVIGPNETEKMVIERAITERKALIERAKDARTADLKALSDLFAHRKKLEATAIEIERVRDVYFDLVARACEAGLDPVARENELTLEGASAYQMGKLATAAAKAGESMSVARVAIDDLGLEAQGKKLPAPSGEKVEGTEGKLGAEGDKAAKGHLGVDTKTSGSLTIEGVKSGDETMLGKLSVQGLGGGLSYDPKENAVILDKFGVKSIGLSNLDWETGTMGLKAPDPITLQELRVSGRIKLGGAKNVLDRVEIGSLSSGALEFRYADYLLGAKKDGKLGAKNVELCHLDLDTFNCGVDAGEVSAEKLAIDLGQGMELSAKSLKTGLSVGALVADGKYDIQLAELAAEDFELKMAGMGVNIAKIAGGKGSVSTDLTKGDYNVDVDLKKLGLGPIHYGADGMVFDTKSGLDCDNVHLKVTVKTDAEGAMHIKVDHVGATHAKIPFVNLTMGTGKSAQTVTVKDASVDALNLRNLDLDTMTLELDAKNLDAKSLAMKMDGMDIATSAHVGSLDFKMLKDAKGQDVMDVAFDKASLNGTVNMGMKDPKKSDGTLLGLDVKNAGGNLKMKGDTISFAGVHVASAGLPQVLWRGGGTSFTGKGIAAKGVKADGYYRGYEKETRGMMLPATDIVVTRLHIDEVSGTSLEYSDPANAMYIAPDPRNPGKQMTLTDLDILDLKMIDGVMKDGKITLDKAVAGGKASLDKLGCFELMGAIEGEGLFCNFKDGAIDYGATKVALKNVHGSMQVGQGEKDLIEFDAPEIFTSVVEGSSLSKYTEEGLDGHVQSANKVWVESLHIPEDVKAKYHLWEGDWKRGRTNEQIAKGRTHQKDEKTSAELEKDKAGALSMQSLRPALSKMLARCNGDLQVGADFAMNGSTLVAGVPHLKIKDGALDPQALLSSLGATEILGLKILPTQDLRIYTVDDGSAFSVKVEMSRTLIAKLGLFLMLASDFMPLLGGAAGAWFGKNYGAELGADFGAAVKDMSPADQEAWMARVKGRKLGGAAGMAGGGGLGLVGGAMVAPIGYVVGLFALVASPFIPRSARTIGVAKGKSAELPAGYDPKDGDSVPLAVALSQFADPEDMEKLLALRRYDPSIDAKALSTTAQRDRFTRETLDAMDALVRIKAEIEREIGMWQGAMDERAKKEAEPKGDPNDPFARYANDPRYQVKQDGYLAHIEQENKKAPLSLLARLSQQHRDIDLVTTEMKTTLRGMGVNIKEDAGASDFSLKVGPMRGFLELARIDKKESYDLLGSELSLDHLRLGINEQAGDGIFGARLQMDQLGIKQKSATGTMEAKLGYADLGFDGLQDRYGFVAVMGKDMPNPLEGKIKGGSKLENLSLSFETDAKAQIRAKKPAKK